MIFEMRSRASSLFMVGHTDAMSFEWRIFFPLLDPPPLLGSPSPDLWQLLDHKPQMGPPEERTDDYFACTHSVGVKLRHQKILEYKVRGPVATCGAELWTRIGERSVIGSSQNLQDFVSGELHQLSAAHEQYKAVLGDAKKAIQAVTKGISSVCLRKKRKRGFLKQLVIEQTDIEVISCSGGQKQGVADCTASSGATEAAELKRAYPTKWRSIAFEESVLEPSQQQPMGIKALLESLGGSSGEPLPPVFKQAGAKVMGYPQFVLEIRDALQASV